MRSLSFFSRGEVCFRTEEIRLQNINTTPVDRHGANPMKVLSLLMMRRKMLKKVKLDMS